MLYNLIKKDISKFGVINEKLEEQQKLYKLISENTKDVIWLIDLETYQYKYVSPSVVNLLKYTPGELMSKSFGYSVTAESYATISDLIPKHISAFESGDDTFATYTMEIELPSKDGLIVQAEVVSTLIKNEDGKVTEVMGVTRDISERKKILTELTIAKEAAEKANKLKTEFLAQMSHEIRSPLNVTLSYADYIKELINGNLTPQLELCFEAMNTASKRIIRTVDLILNMSELQLGLYEPLFIQFDVVSSCLVKIFNEYKTIADKKDLELKMTIETNKTKIYGDQYSIAQIFSNLIDNAIKYTNEGRIHIKVFYDNEYDLKVEISDTGVGISEEYIPRLFDPFSQEEQGYTRGFEGNGLGMALVKKYCDMNNVYVVVESNKGIGTKFTLLFKFIF
jgi:PAS domain S-box-containing protein